VKENILYFTLKEFHLVSLVLEIMNFDTAEKFIGDVVDTGEQFFGGAAAVFLGLLVISFGINDIWEKFYGRCQRHRR
jgi:hypothetical protein